MPRHITYDTQSVGTGPVLVDIEHCRRLGMTEPEIQILVDSTHALSIACSRRAIEAQPKRFLPLNSEGCTFCRGVKDTKGVRSLVRTAPPRCRHG